MGKFIKSLGLVVVGLVVFFGLGFAAMAFLLPPATSKAVQQPAAIASQSVKTSTAISGNGIGQFSYLNPPSLSASVNLKATPTIPLPQATTTPIVADTPTPAPAGVEIVSPTPVPTTNGIIPYKIRIPAIGVEAFVERVGVTKEGAIDVPKDLYDTAWYGYGGGSFRPGDNGKALIDGHLDGTTSGSKAVFWDLHLVKAGDQIFLSDLANHELVFEITGSEVFPYNAVPMANLLGPAPEPSLSLVTCTGLFDRAKLNYEKRLIVYAKLVKHP